MHNSQKVQNLISSKRLIYFALSAKSVEYTRDSAIFQAFPSNFASSQTSYFHIIFLIMRHVQIIIVYISRAYSSIIINLQNSDNITEQFWGSKRSIKALIDKSIAVSASYK